ncbi:MAG TPA: tetratricopeptide repeat protein, partial [Flavobacterium sp.]|nr:tetratricopeptide repeat protein [Flavobacterium sp.]
MKLQSLLCYFTFLFFAASGLAQKATVDSLLTALPKTQNDIARAELLNAIAEQYQATDPVLMQSYAAKALVLSSKIKHRVAEGNALQNLGNANIIAGNYAKALEFFSRAQQLFERENRTSPVIQKALARVYGSIGIVFSEQSNYAKALQYYLKAVSITEKLQDQQKTSKLFNNIGVVYQALN